MVGAGMFCCSSGSSRAPPAPPAPVKARKKEKAFHFIRRGFIKMPHYFYTLYPLVQNRPVCDPTLYP